MCPMVIISSPDKFELAKSYWHILVNSEERISNWLEKQFSWIKCGAGFGIFEG